MDRTDDDRSTCLAGGESGSGQQPDAAARERYYELEEACCRVLDGCGVLSASVEVAYGDSDWKPTPGALEWLRDKLHEDAVEAMNLAAEAIRRRGAAEPAGRQVVP